MNLRAQNRDLTRPEQVLAALLGAGFALGFALTPLGVENRQKQLRSPFIPVFFISVGLLMPLAGVVLLLLRRPRPAAALAIVDAGLMFLTAPADQAKLFFTVEPPPLVTAGEAALTLLGMGYLWYGQRVCDEEEAPRTR